MSFELDSLWQRVFEATGKRMRPPRKMYMVGLEKRMKLDSIPIFNSWLKEKLVVKEQPER